MIFGLLELLCQLGQMLAKFEVLSSSFGRSIDPVVALEHSITRMAVATEAEAEKQGGDNRTMGRKFTVPYGLYRVHGFVSAPLANQTGFSEEDLNLLWEALDNMFEHDSKMGNAHAQDLFARIKVQRRDETKSARSFGDYEVKVDEAGLAGVKLLCKVG